MTSSRRRIASIAAAFCVTACAAALYVRGLDVPPPSGAEFDVTSEARALTVRSGRDAEGRLYPVFWHGSDDRWFAPMPVYVSALALRLFESDAGPRIATAVIGTLGVLLFYGLVARIFQSVGLALVAAVLLLLSPAYVTFSRMATHDGIWAMPIIVTWLLGLTVALGGPREQSQAPITICAAALVASVYSQPSGGLTTLLLGGLTAVALWPARHWTRRTLVMAAVAAALVGLPLALWFSRYPATYASTLGQWLLHPAHIRNPLEWAQALANWNTLSLVSKTYWDFFSPSHLFLSDTAPALAGVYVLPVGILIAIGARDVLRNLGTDVVSGVLPRIALLGFVGVPLVAAAFREPRAIGRALAIVPMGILLATNGIHVMWYSGPRNRAMVVLAVAAAVTQSLAWYVGAVYR